MATTSAPKHTQIDSLILAWLNDKRSRNQSASTCRNYARSLSAWRSFLSFHTIRTGTGSRSADLWDADTTLVRMWQDSMRASELRPATINHTLAGVSSFYEYALATKAVPHSFQANPIRMNISREHVEEYRSAQSLTLDDYDRLLVYLESHSHTLSGARAHALLRTFLHTGWRVGDLLSMRWGDLRPSRTIAGAVLFVMVGADGTPREDVLPGDCYSAILHYLDLAYRPAEDMQPEDFLWTPIREPNTSGFGASVDFTRPICSKTALRVLRAHLKAAGIANADRFRLLDLRHTHALLLLETGASVSAIQDRLGHAQERVTERYLRRTFLREPVDRHTAAFTALRRR